MTKMEMFAQILTHLTNSDEIEFVKHEMELLATKNANRKLSTSQKENLEFKKAIVNFLEENLEEKFTISKLQECISVISTLSNQRMTAILSQLVNSGQVAKSYEKRKAYFYKA